jgi:hypothetical protein
MTAAEPGIHSGLIGKDFRTRRKNMKKTIVLLACLMALAISATAQNQINFTSLPLVASPMPIPSGYDGFTWTNILYVDPAKWSLAGAGYKLSSASNQDVAFVGGTACLAPQDGGYCFGTISVPSNNNPNGVNNPLSFQLVSATVAGGFGPTSITVVAYNNGTYVGSAVYSLTGDLQTINFPASWGGVTAVTFQTEGMGDLVIYNLQVYFLLG